MVLTYTPLSCSLGCMHTADTTTITIAPDGVAVTDLATHSQLECLTQLLTRDWRVSARADWVPRISVIAAVLKTSRSLSRGEDRSMQLNVALIDRGDLFLTFHQMMEHSRATPLTKEGAGALIDYLTGQLAKKGTLG